MLDSTEMGIDEYLIFLNYTTEIIYNILRTRIKTKILDVLTIKEMEKDVISTSIYTSDIEIIQEKKAMFRTHLGWQAMQVVIDYARALKKVSIMAQILMMKNLPNHSLKIHLRVILRGVRLELFYDKSID